MSTFLNGPNSKRTIQINTDSLVQSYVPRPPGGYGTPPAGVAAGSPPAPKPTVTPNQQVVSDIADALHSLPPSVEGTYVTTLLRAASHVGNPIPESVIEQKNRELGFHKPQTTPAVSQFPRASVTDPFLTVIASDADISEALRNMAMMARNNVFDIVDKISSFVSRAKNAGFFPPDNPFVVISKMNSSREAWLPVTPEPALADDLVQNIGYYLELLKAEAAGTINVDRQVESVAQLSSVNMSFEGFGGSGNSAADLMRFLPDLDAIKLQRAKEALSVLDFKTRVPRVIFTANYEPDGVPHGCVIGWKKMADASGYIIKRRNVLDGSEVGFLLTNEDAKVHYEHARSYVKSHVMGFYKNIPEDGIYAFIDSSVTYNGYYIYQVQAYQTFNESRDTFRVNTIPANISPAQRTTILNDMEALDPGRGDSISPYPLLARALLGNDQFDWILAAVNIRSSITRSDPRAETRKYGYLTAQIDFLFSQMDQGKFVIPKDVNQVAQNIIDGITRFGVTQTLIEVLQETGALYHFEGIDPKVDTHFDRVGDEEIRTTGLLSTIVAAIDPETATIDLKSLAYNLPQLLNKGTIRANDLLGAGSKSNIQAVPVEILVPDNVQYTDDIRSEDDIQFLQGYPHKALDRGVDLTTFDGVSKFIRTVRIYADLTADRDPPPIIAAPPVAPIRSVQPTFNPALLTTQEEINTSLANVIRSNERLSIRRDAVTNELSTLQANQGSPLR